MIKTNRYQLKGYNGTEVNYELIAHKNITKKLAIILPGAGYTVQSPVLYYTTRLMLNNHYDVLHVNYQYNSNHYLDFEEIATAVKYDVNLVVDKIIQTSQYTDYTFIGKSLGTTAMSSILKNELFQQGKAIWLTPLIQRDEVYNGMVTYNGKSLAIIGDADPIFKADKWSTIVPLSNFTTMLLPKVNHNLDVPYDLYSSMDCTRKIIEEMESFIIENNQKNDF